MNQAPPTHEQLQAYLLGNVSPREQAAISAYLELHPELSANLVAADSQSDSLLDDLRQPPFYEPEEAVYQQGMAQARSIRLDQVRQQSSDLPITRHIGHYQLHERLNRKGMSIVSHATDERDGSTVAIKTLPPSRIHESATMERFRREMKLVGKLSHPHIVRFLESGEDEGVPYLAMELLIGSDLSELVEHAGPLSVGAACSLIRQAALGLQHAHDNNLVHRDIKPSNIFLTTAGQTKLLDLGLALSLHEVDESLTNSDQLLGTMDYMAPEQAFDTHRVDIRSDIYSLGCTLFKLLVGTAPFSGPEYGHLLKKAMAHSSHPMPAIRLRRPDIPERLEAILARMCAKEPNGRFQKPVEVALALETFADDRLLPGLARKDLGLRNSTSSSSITRDSSIPVPDSNAHPVQPPPRHQWNTILLIAVTGSCLLTITFLIMFCMQPKLRSALMDDHEIEPIASQTAPSTTVDSTDSLNPTPKDTQSLNATVPRKPPTVAHEVGRITQESPYSPILCLSLTPDGRFARTGSNDGKLRIWDLETKKCVLNLNKDPKEYHPIHAFAFQRLGNRCIAVGFPAYVAQWDLSTTQITQWFTGHDVRVGSVDLSPDETVAATGSWDETVRIWDLNRGTCLHVLKPQIGKVLAVAYSPDGQYLASAGRSTAVLFNAASADKVRSLTGHRAFINAIAFTHDSQFLVTAGRDKKCILWRLSTGQQVRTLTGHDDWINAVAISPDNQWLLTGSSDKTIWLWDLKTGEPLRCYKGHDAAVNAVAFVPGKPLAISASEDMTLRMWVLPSVPDSNKIKSNN